MGNIRKEQYAGLAGRVYSRIADLTDTATNKAAALLVGTASTLLAVAAIAPKFRPNGLEDERRSSRAEGVTAGCQLLRALRDR